LLIEKKHKKTICTFNLMKFSLKILTLFLLISYSFKSQTNSSLSYSQLIQISGVVLDQDSGSRIPYVSILVKGTKKYYMSDQRGFFSLVAYPNDEIEFHSISHKNRTYKINDTLNQKYYSIIQLLAKDTILLQEIEIYPWPSKEEFKRAFLALNLNSTDIDRAENNLQRDELSYLERTKTSSSSENYKYVMQAYYTKIYSVGQQPMNNLLNPIKWAQFIDAWRKGKFKSKTSQKK
jgi:hypothetical protein